MSTLLPSSREARGPHKPYFDDGNGIVIFNSDCRDVLSQIAAASVDLVVTSPPYNIGKTYDVAKDHQDDYLDWLSGVMSHAQTTIKGDGAMWVNTGYRVMAHGHIPIAFELFPRVKMFLMQHIVWEYGAGMTYSSRFNHRSEDWLWFVHDKDHYCFNPDTVRDKTLTTYKQDKRCNPNGKQPGSVWYFPHVSGTHAEREDHPAQFPLQMVSRIIKACSEPGDLVLDPFGGVGSTARACKDLGRRCISVDISERYCDIAARRLSQSVFDFEGAPV